MQKKIKPKILISLAVTIQLVCVSVILISIAYIIDSSSKNQIDIVIPTEEPIEIQKTEPVRTSDNDFVAQNYDKKVIRSGIDATERENYLKISSVNIDGKTISMPKEKGDEALGFGFWLYPQVNPDEIGSVLVFGHRRAKLPPSTETFYNLDKVQNGDILEVGYNKKIYYYEIIESRIIEKTDWNSLKNESFNSIKLITCTPLGTSEKRLLVVGKLI